MTPTATPLAHTLQDACRIACVGTTKLYELIGNGELDARKAGRRTVITAESLAHYVQNLPKADIRGPSKRAA